MTVGPWDPPLSHPCLGLPDQILTQRASPSPSPMHAAAPPRPAAFSLPGGQMRCNLMRGAASAHESLADITPELLGYIEALESPIRCALAEQASAQGRTWIHRVQNPAVHTDRYGHWPQWMYKQQSWVRCAPGAPATTT